MWRFKLIALVLSVALSIAFAAVGFGQCVDSVIVAEVSGSAGSTVDVPVYGRVCGYEIGGNLENLDGISFALHFDPTYVTCDSLVYNVTDPLYQSFHDVIPNPQLWAPAIYNDEGCVTLGVTFSFMGSPDIPPGAYRMFDIFFTISGDAVPGVDTLAVVDGVCGDPIVNNYWTYQTTSTYPEKVSGTLTIEEQKYGRIEGTVTNGGTGKPLLKALVIADGDTAETDVNGHYLLEGLLPGNYDVAASAPNFLPGTVMDVRVSGDSTTTVDFGLTCLDTVWVPETLYVHPNSALRIPVYGKFSGLDGEDLDGISFAATFNPTYIQIDSLSYFITDSHWTTLYDVVSAPASLMPSWDNSEGWVGFAIVFDYMGQNDIPPGRYHLFDVCVHSGAIEGWSLFSVADGLGGHPPLFNYLVYQTTTVYPYYTICNVYVPVPIVRGEGVLPNSFALSQNYPNPFNPKTEFSYSLARRSQVKLEIFNLIGEKIVTLVSGEEEAGDYRVTWDGRDAGGAAVASGIYLYRLQAEGFSSTRKMVLLR